MPRSRATCAIGRPNSKTRRTARSRNSSGYFLGAAIAGASPSPRTEPGSGASRKLRVLQQILQDVILRFPRLLSPRPVAKIYMPSRISKGALSAPALVAVTTASYPSQRSVRHACQTGGSLGTDALPTRWRTLGGRAKLLTSFSTLSRRSECGTPAFFVALSVLVSVTEIPARAILLTLATDG